MYTKSFMKNWELKLPMNRSTNNPRTIPLGGLPLDISRSFKTILAGAGLRPLSLAGLPARLTHFGPRFLLEKIECVPAIRQSFSRLDRHLSPPDR
jgi:hypothetical protein